MDSASLRALQRPLKDRYGEDPASADTPVGAEATIGADVTATVTTWAGPVQAGLHPATGGDGSHACSADMLMQALVACAAVTLNSVATANRVPIRHARLVATAKFDARGTLGVDPAAQVGVHDTAVTVEIDTDADDAALERLARVTERYCVVASSLATPPRFEIRRGS